MAPLNLFDYKILLYEFCRFNERLSRAASRRGQKCAARRRVSALPAAGWKASSQEAASGRAARAGEPAMAGSCGSSGRIRASVLPHSCGGPSRRRQEWALWGSCRRERWKARSCVGTRAPASAAPRSSSTWGCAARAEAEAVGAAEALAVGTVAAPRWWARTRL